MKKYRTRDWRPYCGSRGHTLNLDVPPDLGVQLMKRVRATVTVEIDEAPSHPLDDKGMPPAKGATGFIPKTKALLYVLDDVTDRERLLRVLTNAYGQKAQPEEIAPLYACPRLQLTVAGFAPETLRDRQRRVAQHWVRTVGHVPGSYPEVDALLDALEAERVK